MPDNYQIKVADTPGAIQGDEVVNKWFDSFLATINKEFGKSTLWSNEACIEMCSIPKNHEKKVDFKNITLITISCELPGIETSDTITNPNEIKAMVSSLKRKNLYRLGHREHISAHDSRVKFEDKSGNSVTFFLAWANQAFASDLHAKRVYWLTPLARKISAKYCR